MSKVRSFLSILWDAFLPNNVVLVQALGLCPILAIGTSLRGGVALSVCAFAMLVITNAAFWWPARFIPARLQAPVYVILASAVLFGAAVILHLYVSAEIYAQLYVFLPLLAVNTLVVYRTTSSPGNRQLSFSATLADALGSALGFSLVLCIASALREMAIGGTLWNLPLGYEARFPEAAHPFIGFVLLGFMAAALQWFKQLMRRRDEKEVDAE